MSAQSRHGRLAAVLPGYAGPCRERWLVLHGWGQDASYWTPVARRLAAAGIALLCPDLAALARSSAAPAGSHARMAGLIGLLAELAARARVSVVLGHSSGAPPATLLAHELGAVRELVLLEPLPHQMGVSMSLPPSTPRVRPRTTGPHLREHYPFASENTLSTITAATPGPPPGAAPPRSTEDGDRQAAIRKALHTLPVDLLLVRGAWSAFLTAAGAGAILGSVPRAVERVVTGAGHSVHVDQPSALAEVLAGPRIAAQHGGPQA
ncbi:alpha/beta hydrolase [Amycolatopsis sp. PS_44_ISF1]|uniref:alpha/beta fold hydrolase n=1 Tax=Amycolatopsis sp. PS_44_ISF1 TaxID=2974917 RepID=UPI0028DDC321|nr:alpha/beta hydrolase [Amycolatopsis sp. PS_44_ISF1]MDT8911796.1 alpha/beta hydrolase [Amycolatopsis sp. PS_44_ISF1]